MHQLPLTPPGPHAPLTPTLTQAKVVNLSIAHGKTSHGLAKDLNTSLKEAEETVERWGGACQK